MKYPVIALGLLLAAVVAAYVRYQSLDPCDWLERDMTQRSGMPGLVVRGRIRAEFLIQGIANPGPADCLTGWWSFRSESAD